MKKLSILAVAFAAVIFASCNGKKVDNNVDGTDSLKSFEQSQIEASIKVQIDSIAAEYSKLKHPDFVQETEGEGRIVLTKEEKQVKPDYLLEASVADNATTLAEKYRILSALSVDKKIAELYEMPTEDYEKAITKLAADINDPSFKSLDDTKNIFENSTTLYDAMNQNGRINFFWQSASAALVEQLFVISQNSDKFLENVTDEAAENITYRIILLLDAIDRLGQFDPEIKPIAEAVAPLKVLNAMSVKELKSQIAEAKEKIEAARKSLVK